MSRRKKPSIDLNVIKNKASDTAHEAVSWFNHFTVETRIGLVFLSVVSFVLLFFPLATFVPLSSGATVSMRFLSLSFWKSSLLILVIMATLWSWYLFPFFKQTIYRTLGFKDNDYLFVFFLLLARLGHLVGMEESLSFAMDATETISIASGYYILLILIFVGLMYSLVRLLDEAKIMRKTDFMGFVDTSTDAQESHDVASLFDAEEE